ncbi:MAG TPA: hypothetical protein VFD31_12345 [Thermoleophilaceae bacterium]|nr:hypothetical protein [Thermoleophilaceae bacterium]
MPRDADHYEPLPPLTRLPAFLWRKLGRTGRILLVGVLAAAAITAVLTVPGSRDSAQQREAREAREIQRRKDARIEALRARMRPRLVKASSLAPLERAIARDARRRTGERILRVDCERQRPTGARPGTRLSCLAVRTEFDAGDATIGGRLGYPYAALARFGRSRATYCRVFGIPAEGGLTKRQELTISPRCGGRG